jgi:UDP-N-acetylglucosamine acyltransferase
LNSSDQIIHPTAVVEAGAKLGKGVKIGPFCHVGPDVDLGSGVELVSHVVVAGATAIGAGTRVFPHVTLGMTPQSVRHKGGHTTLTIGKNCVIRECVTMHVGSDTGRGATTVGDGGMFMAYSHVAHDCIVGNNVTFANSATIAGHCEVGDNVIISGLTAVHQFVRIGHHAFLGGCSAIVGDVIPYGMAEGNKARLRGFNIVGMKRSGFSRDDLAIMRQAYKVLFNPEHSLSENTPLVAEKFAQSESVTDLVRFMRSRGKRFFTVPDRHTSAYTDDDAEEGK